MMVSYASVGVNPFSDDSVREPRDVSFSVKGLNDGPLSELVKAFAALDRQPLPRRPIKGEKPQLVISPDRGYGKSHLLGRLFSALSRRATKVYLRPYEDPYKAWQSILLLTIQEMERTEDEASPGTATQLRAFAIAALARVAADLIVAHGGLGGRESADVLLRALQEVSPSTGLPHPVVLQSISWLLKEVDTSRGARVVSDLRQRGIDLLGREIAWVKVLAAHALEEPYSRKERAATKWLRAEPLELHEAALLGIHAADNEGRADCPQQELNALSLQRLRGLCLLACYHRPFLFCFDQTESYSADKEKARALGICVESLYADLPNQLTVITANAHNWELISKHMEASHRDRLSPKIDLEAIEEQGARELIEARLEEYDLKEGDVQRFFHNGWLADFFGAVPRRGVRDVLQGASKRFRELVHQPCDPGQSLAELFTRGVNEVRSKAALKTYSQDSLMWFTKEVGQGLAGVSTGRTAKNKYFSFGWIWPGRLVAFAFEGGANWNRWNAIADEAVRIVLEDPKRSHLFYVFRTPDLEKVPRESWAPAKQRLEEAHARGFQIRELTIDQVCEIHAARELYSDALEENIDYSPAETLRWLQEHFAPFLQELAYRKLPEQQKSAGIDSGDILADFRIMGDVPTPMAELDPREVGIVAEMVRENRIVDIRSVLDRLGDYSLRDAVLRSVERHPNLRAHPGPKTIYLQWRNTPSQRAG
jgi:hypothetical protein